MRAARNKTPGRRAFSLIEALAVIVVLGIAIPPASMLLVDAGGARRDAVMTARATWLATGVLEHVLADVNSAEPNRGFAALADSALYLDDPTDGLLARLAVTIAFYQGLGLDAAVAISGLVAADGTATGDVYQDLFRRVSVTVSWTDSAGQARSLVIGAQVTDL